MTTEEAISTQNGEISPVNFPCRKGCDREFPTNAGRTMHEIRAHGKKWASTGRSAGRKSPPSKLKYQARLRARNIAKGLTAAGKPRKQPLRATYLANHPETAPAPVQERRKPSIKAVQDLPHVLACPRCGLNIRNIAMAMAFGDKQ